MNGGRRNGRILVYVDVDVSQRCHVLHKLSTGFLFLFLFFLFLLFLFLHFLLHRLLHRLLLLSHMDKQPLFR